MSVRMHDRYVAFWVRNGLGEELTFASLAVSWVQINPME